MIMDPAPFMLLCCTSGLIHAIMLLWSYCAELPAASERA